MDKYIVVTDGFSFRIKTFSRSTGDPKFVIDPLTKFTAQFRFKEDAERYIHYNLTIDESVWRDA